MTAVGEGVFIGDELGCDAEDGAIVLDAVVGGVDVDSNAFPPSCALAFLSMANKELIELVRSCSLLVSCVYVSLLVGFSSLASFVFLSALCVSSVVVSSSLSSLLHSSIASMVTVLVSFRFLLSAINATSSKTSQSPFVMGVHKYKCKYTYNRKYNYKHE